MSDVTLSFVANDQGVIQSLARQEAAINASIGRMNNRFASIGNKFVGPAALGGFLGGVGIGSLFAVTSNLIDGYSRSSEEAAERTRALREEWNRFWTISGSVVVGGVVDAVSQIGDGLRELPDALRPAFGAVGLLNTDLFTSFRESADEARKLDKWAESTKKNMELSAKHAETIAKANATLGRAQAEFNNRGDDFARRRAVAFVDFRAEERRLGSLGPDANQEEVRILREANRLRLENTLSAADRAEEDAARRRREQDDKERFDYERRVKAERENATLQRASLNIMTLRAGGRTAEADAAERELELRTRLLDIEKMQHLRYEERMGLIEATTGLFEAQTEAAIRAAGAVTGGRGVESGLASAAGVVRGSLVATARDNPAALQRETNQILRKILDAVEDGSAATFAP